MDKSERENRRKAAQEIIDSVEGDYGMYEIKATRFIDLLDHIDALEERLFGALQTDQVLKLAVREVDHASPMSRSVVSDVIDLACVQKARIGALERQIADARWRANDVREQLLGPFHNMDEFGATSLNLKRVVEILDAAIASASECKMCGGKGMIGGFINAENGYHSEPCPDCSSASASEVPIHEG
jgi:hypothetical protein